MTHLLRIPGLLVLCVLLLSPSPASPEAFTSIASLKTLLNNEEVLLDKMEEYLDMEEARLDSIREYMEELTELTSKRETLSDDAWENYVNKLVEHPIDAFNVIKSWYEVTQLATSASAELFSTVTHAAENRGVSLPQDMDYQGSIAALVRLQKTYKIPTRDLAQGRVYNLTAREGLDHEDYFQMGTICMEVDHSLADSWFDLLLEERVEDKETLINIYRHKMEIYKKCDDTERALISANQLLQLDPSNEFIQSEKVRIEGLWNDKIQRGTHLMQHFYWKSARDKGLEYYEALCRGDNIRNTIFVNKDLMCIYRRGILPYIQYKEEIHSFDPRISLLIDVISDRQADMLKEKAFPSLYRAHVGDPSKSIVTNERISKLAWLWDTDEDVRMVSDRVADITGLSTEYNTYLSHAEAFQIVNYGLGGQYEPHYDFYEHDMLAKLPDFIMGTGDRIATFMYYLSEPQAGGATVFPSIGVRVPPVKNAAAFWYNFRLDGNMGDRQTLHAGCPVLLGQKWVGNKWIRQSGQVFKRPCALEVHQSDPIWYNT